MRLMSIIILISSLTINHLKATTIIIPTDYGTIQEGINAASVGDTVLVEPGIYVENISFFGKNVKLASLYLTTLDTTYISQTIIDGNQSDSVVRFESMEDSTALLSGFTLTNGSNMLGGGGIFCFAFSSPTLENLIITGNTGAGGGGVMCFGYANPRLINVTIKENTAVLFGGGLYCEFASNPTLDFVTIRDNMSFQDGGGLYFLDSCQASLSDVLIENNYAERSGGGIGCQTGSNISLNRVELNNNTAEFFGGGLYSIASSPHIENSSIRNNIADEGGGIYTTSSQSPDLVNVLIEDNRAYKDGGGIALMESDVSLENVTIRNNVANEKGGGIYGDASIPDFDVSNRSNIYLNFAGSAGNDFYALNSQLITVILDTFTVNDFPAEYQVYPFTDFAFSVLHGKVQKTSSDLYISPSGSNDNTGLSTDQTLKTISYALTKARGDQQNPQTIYLDFGTYSAGSNNEIFPLNMKDFISITGDSDSVAVLDAERQSSVVVFDQDEGISLNSITLTGGSAIEGGGILCEESDPYLNRVIIHGNTAEYGGGIYSNRGSNLYVLNSTITDNEVTAGGAIYCQNNNTTLVNSILWNNLPQEIYIDEAADSAMLTIAYSNIQGGEIGINVTATTNLYWLEGNIDSDPLYVDATLDNYRLQETSPCINSGEQNMSIPYDNGNKILEIPAMIFSGVAPDMGAWEYQEIIDGFAGNTAGPLHFNLYQNYPNPFNPLTRINFSLPTADNVSIKIYNTLGQLVETVLEEKLPAGLHGIDFDGNNYASGMYFYQILTSNNVQVKKMMLVK
jgi:predicted outer membrane repeat protein